jgi:serine/threonine protein kinase
MNFVYRAEDAKIERSVSLKFRPPDLLDDEDILKRFGRESTTVAALNHPNIWLCSKWTRRTIVRSSEWR